MRHDGGGEAVAGVELGAGVTFSDPDSGLGIDAKARMLVARADSEHEEWRASATTRPDPGADGAPATPHAGLSLAGGGLQTCATNAAASRSPPTRCPPSVAGRPVPQYGCPDFDERSEPRCP